METSGNRSDEQGQSNKRRRILRGPRSRWVLRVVLALAPLATKLVELAIVIVKTLK